MPQLSDLPLADVPPAAPATQSPFVVRVAGLPVSALTGLSSAPLRAALGAVVAADRWLAAEGESLADALRPVIGAPADPALKPHLVGLRRSLFRGRAPRGPEWSQPVRDGLPADLGRRIERWIQRYGERARQTAALPDILAEETRRTRRSLLGTVADAEFRHGLAQSSPTLSAELEKWLAHRDGEPARRVLVRLARYVSRAAAKTSPNTTFTTIGAGLWTAGDTAPPLALTPLPSRRGLVELRGTVFTEVATALSAHPALRPALLVRANPSLTRLGDRLIVLGGRPAEDIASVGAVPEVTRCLAALGGGRQPLDQLHARLAGGAPAPKVAAFVDRLIELGVIELHVPVDDQCEDKFGALARWLREVGGDAVATDRAGVAGGSGLGAGWAEAGGGLAAESAEADGSHAANDGPADTDDHAAAERAEVADGQAATEQAEVIRGLLARDRPAATGSHAAPGPPPALPGRADPDPDPAAVAAASARLSQLLSPPTGLADVDGHRVRLRRIRAAVGELRTAAGLAADPAEGAALTHEYAVFGRPVATAGLRAWEPALAGLDQVRRWMAPHDSSLPLRLALGSYWAGRFDAGARVPFLVFYQTLLGDLRRHRDGSALTDLRAQLTPGTSSAAQWRLPVLKELAGLRQESLDALRHAVPDRDEVVRVDPARLGEWAAGLPGYVRPTDAVAWFVQSDGRRLVLNSAMGGHGRGLGRPLYLIARGNGGRLPADLAPYSLPDPPEAAGTDHRPAAVTADSSGDFGQTLNLRLPGRGHELDYPFTVHPGGRRPRIALRELVVESDPATGLLRLRRAGDDVIVTPAHTGMLVDSGLPPALQLLTRGLGANPGWLLRPDDLFHRVPGGTEVAFAPRIEAGPVVLRRATWTVPAALLPRRGRGEPDATLLLRLHRWLAEYGIPDRCFLRTNTPAGAHWTDPAFAKARKPLYLDFASPWLVALFEKLTAAATEEVAFSEPLPAVGTGGGPADDERRVTELVVETRAVRP